MLQLLPPELLRQLYRYFDLTSLLTLREVSSFTASFANLRLHSKQILNVKEEYVNAHAASARRKLRIDPQKMALFLRNYLPNLKELCLRGTPLHLSLSAMIQVLNLRVLCFGQMILLEYAVRLQGDHDRMGAILQFLYDMLRATDFEHDIPRIINRYHATMTRGMDPKTTDPKKSPFPTEVDLKSAAEHWLCYCHRAFIYFLTHLSGNIHWNVEWLQSKELNRDFRRAVSDNILMKAHNVFQDLRRRVYQQYVLRRIHALETGDTTYGWTRLPDARKAAESDPSGRFKINTTIIGKTVIFMADEIFNSAFVKTMKKEDILLNWMPSTNREDVLYSVRKFIPGPVTERVIFWFGQTYIFNGNEDYGQLVSELCYHYTTHFGLIDQCVILPAYDRTHRQIWTQEVLCLFLQRRLAVPHAQVVLHPYDLRLWQADQPAAERGGTPPPWTNRNQSEEGFIYKLGAIEARKENMRTFHGLDLWTWYMRDNPGLPPPPELYEQRAVPDFRPRGNALAAQLAAQEEQSSTGAPAAHSAAAAIQPNEPSSTPAPAAPQPTPSATTSSLATTDIVTELITRMLSGPLLQTIIVDATQQAVRQVSTEIDAKLERIEALLRRRASQQSNATAEHRPQGTGSDA